MGAEQEEIVPKEAKKVKSELIAPLRGQETQGSLGLVVREMVTRDRARSGDRPEQSTGQD